MKTKCLLLAIVSVFPITLWAQEDDMYFIPTKKSKTVEAVVETTSREVSLPASGTRDIDEYNRRGAARKSQNAEVVMTDTLGMQWILTQNEKGESVWMPAEDVKTSTSQDYTQAYIDGYEDATEDYYSKRLARFHGYVYYPSFRFYDPWYDDIWYYDSWFYRPWHYGYYGWSGYASWRYGWSGWYGSPWYYGYGWGPGWYGIGCYHPHNYVGGGMRRGSTFGHTTGGALASGRRGGSISNSVRRGSSFGTGRAGSIRGGSTRSVSTETTGRSAASRFRTTEMGTTRSSGSTPRSYSTPTRSSSSRSSDSYMRGGGTSRSSGGGFGGSSGGSFGGSTSRSGGGLSGSSRGGGGRR